MIKYTPKDFKENGLTFNLYDGTTATFKENEISFSYEKNKIKMEEIINLIQKDNVKILDISTDDADLEDVFLGLTKNR